VIRDAIGNRAVLVVFDRLIGIIARVREAISDFKSRRIDSFVHCFIASFEELLRVMFQLASEK